ncbi:MULTISPECIES: hypothetical protein [unclassified Pandoraea]|uniref:hypothetical protein n=1 Tax=unclassified Pandoraea TaxID=2624094 RepID=UPI000B3FBDDB|nr:MULTISPECIES: hypothetical protein [unclassified Pandoraea]
MSDAKDDDTQPPKRKRGKGKRAGAAKPHPVPQALPREGYVVWFLNHGKFLGYAWSEPEQEIRRAHVKNAEHAIYFDTFAQAAVVSAKLISPSRVLHSPGPGMSPTVMG